ncbi:MAG: SGNH/GDSL hydrolase family protein [Pirellula sp.]
MLTANGRYWTLRIMLMGVGLLPFLTAELWLRLTWSGPILQSVDPCLDEEQITPLFERSGNTLCIRRERLQFFAPARFDAVKSSNTKRIFCIGGSTTQGEPFKPPTAFPEWLEQNLSLIDPGQQWEVINCGGLSYASYRLLPILYEVLRYEPDLIVVDCGHNEFLEDREFSQWHQTPASLRKALWLARSSRLVQFACNSCTHSRRQGDDSNATYLKQEVDALLDYQGGLEKYHRDSSHRASVENSLRWNVEAMIRACKHANVPLVLLAPTCNLRDCPPFKVECDPMIDTKLQVELNELWSQVTTGSQPATNPIEILDRILEIDASHAGALYWRGQIALEKGEYGIAIRYLADARDADVCPLRSSSTTQASIRELAEQHNVWCFDVDAMFRNVSKDGIVGNQWLVDHVHPRIEGHQLMGERLAELLIREKWVKPNSDDWREHRSETYRKHLGQLGEEYFVRGKQRLSGLMLWTQGRAKKGLIFTESRL